MQKDPETPQTLLDVGWREWVALPQLGVASLKAKLDTGARSSSLHVDHLEEFEQDQARWVRFEIRSARRRQRRPVVCAAPVSDERVVTDSSGNRRPRLFIRTTILLGACRFEIETNLTNRQDMLFAMLIGRTALAGRMRVDPARSYALGRPQRPLLQVAL